MRLRDYSVEEVKLVMLNANSVSEVLCRLLDNNASGCYKAFKKFVEKHGLEQEHQQVLERSKANMFITNKRYTNEELFVKGFLRKGAVRKRVLRDNLISYQCYFEDCPTRTMKEWRGNDFIYELDHIDGDRCNNELSNLRFICSICHQHTETYGSKNYKKCSGRKRHFCLDCSSEVSKVSSRCKSCTYKQRISTRDRTEVATEKFFRPRKFEVSKEELEQLIEIKSIEQLALDYGVSGNALRKRAKLLGVTLKPRGYWAKVYAGIC